MRAVEDPHIAGDPLKRLRDLVAHLGFVVESSLAVSPLSVPPARRDRPRRRAAEQGDELATAAHSITSSARAMNVGVSSRPSALAVFKFTARSNFVGSSTGRSAGLVPCRILCT